MSRASIINALQSCIDDSNATTGRSDTNVTDCVNRLIRGYGGGGTNIIADVDVTGDGTEHITFNCPEEPDAVIIYPIAWTFDDVSVSSALCYCAVKGKFVIGMRSTGTTRQYSGASALDDVNYPWGKATGNYAVGGSYANGVFDAHSRGPAQCKWSSTYTYRCIGIKF